MKESLRGTYWLVSLKGERWITQGDKPTGSGHTTYTRNGKGIGWVQPGKKLPMTKDEDDNVVSGKDFEGIDFPDITDEDEPMEIEISKSGKVYTY